MNNFDSTETFVEHLIRVWQESDHEISLYEFLRLTPQQYTLYVQGELSDREIEKIYNEKRIN